MFLEIEDLKQVSKLALKSVLSFSIRSTRLNRLDSPVYLDILKLSLKQQSLLDMIDISMSLRRINSTHPLASLFPRASC